MAKLYLRFEGKELKEVAVAQNAVITIGRLPDNVLQIDNLAVSGHHAKVYWEGEHYVLEDNGSLNGTYVNNQRVTKHQLKDGDNVLIGKHSVQFKDEWHDDQAGHAPAAKAGPAVPQMQSTVVLDTKKAKELMAQARAASASTGTVAEMKPPTAEQLSDGAPPPMAAKPVPPTPPKERTGMLTVIEGKTDEPSYVLSSKMSVIGKSAMASIKLKGSLFKSPPEVAAMVSKRENKYYITQQDKHARVKVNGTDASAGQHELEEGDIVEVAGVKMTFAWHE